MKTCNLSDFMKALTPWFDDDYIRKACLDDNSHFVWLFTDGVKNVYHIENCETSQLETILEDLKKKVSPLNCPNKYFREFLMHITFKCPNIRIGKLNPN